MYVFVVVVQAVKIISTPSDNKRDELRMRICQTYRQVESKEHQRILQRRKMIEDRKEELENLTSMRVSCLKNLVSMLYT